MPNVTLGSGKTTFEDVAEKYSNFQAPGFKLTIGGTDVRATGMAISNLTVETTTTQEADVVTFTVSNAFDMTNREFEWLGDTIALGKELEVHLGYVDKMHPVFYGHITAVKVTATEEGFPEIEVTGMDVSFKLMRGRTVKAFFNKKISDIVREIAQSHGLTPDVDQTAFTIPMLLRKPQSDYQFLQDLAQWVNYDFFIVGKKLYFREKNKDKDPFITLEFGKNLIRVEIEQNLAEQVTQVRVRGWDAKEQSAIDVSSSTVNKIGSNPRTGADVLRSLGGNYEEVLHANVQDMREAQKMAEAAMNARALRLVTGEGVCLGIPEIRAGRYIQLKGLGKRLNQPYYIIRAVHEFDVSGYTTSFTFQGNAV